MTDAILFENEPLNNYCSYKTGGTANYFALPRSVQELKDIITWSVSMNLPHEIIGAGANILVSDKGYDGLVICLKDFEKWCLRQGNKIYAGAGAILNDVVNYAAVENLSGLENLAGIPGTVGGAVKMNAGAYDSEMKDIVSRISLLESTDKGLKDCMVPAAEAGFSYREARGLLGKIVLAAEFDMTPANSDLKEYISGIKRQRAEKQPLNYPSCGSVFKRPQGHYASALIDECGLKGLSVGGAQVSEKHAGFIVNKSNATSADIYRLIQLVKVAVFQEKGVNLTEEVKYIGDFTSI